MKLQYKIFMLIDDRAYHSIHNIIVNPIYLIYKIDLAFLLELFILESISSNVRNVVSRHIRNKLESYVF